MAYGAGAARPRHRQRDEKQCLNGIDQHQRQRQPQPQRQTHHDNPRHHNGHDRTPVWIHSSLLERHDPQSSSTSSVCSSSTATSSSSSRRRFRRVTSAPAAPPGGDGRTSSSSSSSWGWVRGYLHPPPSSAPLPPLTSTLPSRSAAAADNDGTSSPIKRCEAPNGSGSGAGGSPYGRNRLRRTGSSSPPWSTPPPSSLSSGESSAVGKKRPPPWKREDGSPTIVTVTVDDPTESRYHGRTFAVSLPPTRDGVDRSVDHGGGGGDEEEDGHQRGLLMANGWWSDASAHLDDDKVGGGNSSGDPFRRRPPSDLIELTHLHEPAVVHALRVRYASDEVYAYTGPILLALNPFKKIDGLYGREAMGRYCSSSGEGGGDGEGSKYGIGRQSGGEKEVTAEGKGDKTEPHVYAVAERAYRSMLRSFDDDAPPSPRADGSDDGDGGGSGNGGGDQSILVSGESGAGKTVTTKIVMQYLAALSERRHQRRGGGGSASSMGEGGGGGSGVEQQVLQSNPILESFGNARTIRNDNSSRFGKFTRIEFAPDGVLVGASIEAYLLEKVRLISQSHGERNYHVFYELLAGLTPVERKEFGLGNATAEDFDMTSNSGTYDRRDGVRDVDTYRDLLVAMDTVGFSAEERSCVFRTCCALLHASNLTFVEGSGEEDSSDVDGRDPSLQPALCLLGVTVDALRGALCVCTIDAGGERLTKNLSVDSAGKALEAFIKATYGALFGHIVRRVNSSIKVGGDGAGGNKNGAASIGLLDIFGFESFAINSFEQLCINFCNETLQAQFNRFVFQVEQREYQREGIAWDFIDFPDNQDVLDLIERRHEGVLSVLDEQCRLARCTDRSFALASYEKCAGHPRFEASDTQRSSGLFSIRHYAGLVEYDTRGFLEKNKDELPKETTDLLLSSSNRILPLLGRILSELPSPGCGSGSAATMQRGGFHRSSSSSLSRPTVGNEFGVQLRRLRERVDRTSPHYIRCLKPNDRLVHDNFDSLLIAHQLRCAGVLEAIRVSRVGYPQRYTHMSFLRRYQILALRELGRAWRRRQGDLTNLCRVLIDAILPDLSHTDNTGESAPAITREGDPNADLMSVGVQIGNTKVFLRRRAFHILEDLRSQKIGAAAVTIQSGLRMFLARQSYYVAMWSVITIQSAIRRSIATRTVRAIRCRHFALILQRSWRRFYALVSFRAIAFIARWCQRLYRGQRGRSRFLQLNMDRKSILLQRCWRAHISRSLFLRKRKLACALQCLARTRKAISVYRKLKRDAKDLDQVTKERDKLRKEMQQMKQQLKKANERAVNEDKVVISAENSGTERMEQTASHAAAPLDVQFLQKEVQRLKQELALISHTSDSTIVYQGFPSNPTARDEELRHLAEVCAQKDIELEFLRREIESLRLERDSDISASRDEKKMDISDSLVTSSSFDSQSARNTPSSHKQRTKGGMFAPLAPLKMFLGVGSDDSFATSPSQRQRKLHSSFVINQSLEAGDTKSLASTSLLDGETLEADEQPELESSHITVQSSSDSALTCGLDHPPYASLTAGSPRVSESTAQDTPFHLAVRDSNKASLLEAVTHSKDIHGDINKGDGDGRSPLHLATLNSDRDMVSFLLSNHAVANSQDNAGNTPLHYSDSCSIVELLLGVGGANPNIPNADGLCALHLAVRRRDVQSVRCLLSHNADVNCAEHVRWYTPLHLVSQSESHPSHSRETSQQASLSTCQIAKLLCQVTLPSKPDMNYQDRDGNAPFHHAASLREVWAGELISIFIEHGANLTMKNDSGQTVLHLLCQNEPMRRLRSFQETLHLCLYNGGDPNQATMTGCTALHLALFYRDIDSAVQLVYHGAGLNLPWKKPNNWEAFWPEMDSEVLPTDMIEDENSLRRILSAISTLQQWAPQRPYCMHCKSLFGTFSRQHHCRHCGRLVCGQCSPRKIIRDCFPGNAKQIEQSTGSLRVCSVCEEILLARVENKDSMLTEPLSAQNDA